MLQHHPKHLDTKSEINIYGRVKFILNRDKDIMNSGKWREPFG